MKISEFCALIEICRKSYDAFMKYIAAAYFIFQFHKITHLDYIFHFKEQNLLQI